DLLSFTRLVLEVYEAVSEHHPRRLQPGSHQHRRPEGAMEASDVLADEMDVGRPPLAETLLVRAVADRRDVVEQGVEPDVDRQRLVERHPDAPVLAGAG